MQPEPVNADAGAGSQKAWPPPVASLLPKTAHIQDGYTAMNTTPRFLLQDLVKQAQASAMDRARIAKEAAHQMKVATEGCEGECADDKKKKEKDSCAKTGSANEVTTEYAMKLASAVEFVLPYISKMAAPQAPPPHMTETTVEPGKGPGATKVLESNVGGTPPGPGAQGKATPANTPPTSTGTQKSTAAGPSTQLENTINNPPGGTGEQTTAMPSGKGKTAEAVYAGNLEVLKKMAGTPEGDPEFLGMKGRELAMHAGRNMGGNTLGAAGMVGGGLAGAGIGALAGHYTGEGAGAGAATGGLIGAVGGDLLGHVAGQHAGEDLAGAQHDVASEEYKRMLEARASGAMKGQGAGMLAGGLGGGLGAYHLTKGTPYAGLASTGGALAGMMGGGALGHVLGGEINQARYSPTRDKESSAIPPIVAAFLATIKQAEDAINPAHISAGPAVPPNATQSGEGTPPTPNGSAMVGSNESAINYTKQQAKAEPKRDMSAYVSEPALSSSHDNTLQQAFSHTGDAGVKMSSADAAMQVSRARALLESIAAAANK